MAKQSKGRKVGRQKKSRANAAYIAEFRHDKHKRLNTEREARRQKEGKEMRVPRGTARAMRRTHIQKEAA